MKRYTLEVMKSRIVTYSDRLEIEAKTSDMALRLAEEAVEDGDVFWKEVGSSDPDITYRIIDEVTIDEE